MVLSSVKVIGFCTRSKIKSWCFNNNIFCQSDLWEEFALDILANIVLLCPFRYILTSYKSIKSIHLTLNNDSEGGEDNTAPECSVAIIENGLKTFLQQYTYCTVFHSVLFKEFLNSLIIPPLHQGQNKDCALKK